MAGEFDSWLRALSAAGKGPAPLAATRGRRFSDDIWLPGDWTGATVAGQVRAAPDASGSPLVTFTCPAPVVADGWSKFTLSLASGTGANSTGALPADGDGSGLASFPYDLTITPSGGVPELLLGGPFNLIGRITP